jgi:hypothetical protein
MGKQTPSDVDCLPLLIKTVYGTKNQKSERIDYFKRFFVDSVYFSEISTYCAGLIFGENEKDKIRKFFDPIHQSISEGLESVKNIIMF